MLVTSDGVHWARRVVPPGTSGLRAVTCADTTHCYAAGSSGLISSSDGGTNWQTDTIPTAVGIAGVACPTSAVCYAAGDDSTTGHGVVLTNTNGGAQWRSTAFPATAGAISGISCPDTTTCVTVGTRIQRTSDSGATWTRESLPNTGLQFAGVAPVTCPSLTTCFALTTGLANGPVIATTNGGASWHHQKSSGGQVGPGGSITCVSAQICYIAGINIFTVTTNGGTNWTGEIPPFARSTVAAASQVTLEGIACPSSTSCVAVGTKGLNNGAAVEQTPDGGTTWTAGQLPVELSTLFSITCPSVSTCRALGGNQQGNIAVGSQGTAVVTTSDGGTTWTHRALGRSATTSDFFLLGIGPAISCGTTSACVAVGEGIKVNNNNLVPRIELTTDGGATWTLHQPPTSVGSVSAVSCPSATVCFAVGVRAGESAGGVVIKTTNGASTWKVLQSHPSAQELVHITCSSVSNCVASANNGNIVVTSDGGTTWTRHTGLGIAAVTCATAAVCYGVSTNTAPPTIEHSTDGGTTWTPETIPASVSSLAGIACSTATNCHAVGEAGDQAAMLLTTDGGSTWTSQNIPTVSSLQSVDCPTTTACYASGTNTNGGGVILTGA